MRTSIYKDFPVGYPDPEVVLGYGELFVELPLKDSDNIRIKYGDGKTKWKDLPYRLGDTSTDELYFTESDESSLNNALSKVVNGTDVRTAIANLKRAIELTSLASGIVPNISKENVNIDKSKTYTSASEAIKALTANEPLEVVLGTMSQAIQLTFENCAEGIDVSASKIIIKPDYSATVEEALDKVNSDNDLGTILGALKNAVNLIETSGISNVSGAEINYSESNAKTVTEALEEASNGSSLNEIVAGLKRAIKLVQIGGGQAIDVTDSAIASKSNKAESKEEALNDADTAKKLGDVIAAIKRAIVLTNELSDFGEEQLDDRAAKLSASLNQINNTLATRINPVVGYGSNNAIDQRIDISGKEVFYNNSSAKTKNDALKECTTGEPLSAIVAGLKKAIELMDRDIDISTLTVDYIDDESTSVESVADNARAGKQLKDILASLKRSIILLNKKVENQKRVSFTTDSPNANSATEYVNKIVTGSELSDIIVNLKKAIILLDNKAITPPDLDSYSLQIIKKKFTSATTAANSIKNKIGVSDAVSALKQAILLLDDTKEDKDAPISKRVVYFDNDKSTNRDMALKSVLSGKSVSDNIAALKRAIELTSTNDEISSNIISFNPDKTSGTVERALDQIKSGNTLGNDIASLRRAIELLYNSDIKDIDISTKKVEWNLITTGTTLDALSNISSGKDLNVLMPYIKKVLSDTITELKVIKSRQDDLQNKINQISAKLK